MTPSNGKEGRDWQWKCSPPIRSEEKSQQVIDAQHKFAKKKYHAQFIWEPSPKLEASIVKEIFEYDKK